MSDTPKLADECRRLLDNGWEIKLWRNPLGSYTARARIPMYNTDRNPEEATIYKAVTTDDFEPSQALYRVTKKCLG
jgi:hypothetical protein